ncbi:MAG: murein biosynthesis integral membrane protein MurJ [Acidobacteriota bacterium]|nr:murein biosynthesis integral membrane protein MurJ [Acidobacteriota bacterium]
MTIATLLSRVLGLARDVVLAAIFGAGAAMDAFNVATRIPNLVRDLFAEGAMSAAFVPTFTRHVKEKGIDSAWRLGSNVINALVVVTGTLVVLGMIFAYPLADFYTDDARFAAQLPLTASLTRWTLPFLTMVAIAVAQAGMLNSLRQFFIPAVSPAMYNVAIILSAFALVPFAPALGIEPITAIAIGSLVGGLLQIITQWPALRASGFRYRPVLDFKDPGLRQVLLLMGPGTIGVAAAQINLAVNTWLATSQGEGAVTALTYAFRLMYLPIGLFGVSVATAAIPELARQATGEGFTEMRRTISSALRMMLVLSVPSMVGLAVLARPITQMLLERGAFTPDDTTAVAWALLMYAPGLLGYSIVKIASPSFYALKDARTPVIISMITVGTNVVLNLALVRVMGFGGLALGTAIASLVNAGLLMLLLGRRIGGIDGSRVLVTFVKIALASAAMGAAAYYGQQWLAGMAGTSNTGTRAIAVTGGIAAGVIALGAAAKVLRLAEFEDAVSAILRRVRGSGSAA